MDLWLIRHTRLALDSGVCYGRSEIELADSFDEEKRLLRLQLPKSFDSVHSSPSARCQRLAIDFGSVNTDERLCEYDFGDWELQAWDEIDGNALDLWMQDFVNQRPPNGETLVEMAARVDTFIDELRGQTQEQALIITHGGVIRCVLAKLLQIPLVQIFKIHVGYGTVWRARLGQTPDLDQVFSE